MNIQIRKAQPKDVVPIATLVQDLGMFAHINAQPLEATIELIVRHLEMCDADNSHSVYVAEVDGELKGYAAVHWVPYLMLAGPEGYVSELFVSETARSQGIGTKLLDTIEQEARTRGCSRLGLLNSRARDSYKRGYYKKHGWVEREEVANFIFKLIN